MENKESNRKKKWEWERTRLFIEEFVFPPPHSSNCLGDSLRLEIKRTLFETVVMVRIGVWNTNCWDLLSKSYLLPLTVWETVKANQPLRWDVDTNSEKRGWTFAQSRLKIRLAKQVTFVEYGKPKMTMFKVNSNDWYSVEKNMGNQKNKQITYICLFLRKLNVSGTGSSPPSTKGWQRPIRASPINKPLSPCLFKASIM